MTTWDLVCMTDHRPEGVPAGSHIGSGYKSKRAATVAASPWLDGHHAIEVRKVPTVIPTDPGLYRIDDGKVIELTSGGNWLSPDGLTNTRIWAERSTTFTRLGITGLAASADSDVAAAIIAAIRAHCTPSSEAYRAGGDLLIYAVADWIENPPEWVKASWRKPQSIHSSTSGDAK